MNERYLVSGKRVDTGEYVTGYYCKKTYLKIKKMHVGDFIVTIQKIGFDKITGFFMVDPATVEPVAVKPKKSDSGEYHICPNCERLISEREPSHGKIQIPYCKWCGQRIDWS